MVLLIEKYYLMLFNSNDITAIVEPIKVQHVTTKTNTSHGKILTMNIQNTKSK